MIKIRKQHVQANIFPKDLIQPKIRRCFIYRLHKTKQMHLINIVAYKVVQCQTHATNILVETPSIMNLTDMGPWIWFLGIGLLSVIPFP